MVNYLGGQDVAGNKLKAKPIIKKTIQYYDTGGYYESIRCSNCAVASNEYKKICSRCKGTGSVTTNKYIPKSKEKYNMEETIGGWNGTNESGFTGLPGGYRNYDYNDYIGHDGGNWWSSTEDRTARRALAWYRCLVYDKYTYSYQNDTGYGFSVRCLRD